MLLTLTVGSDSRNHGGRRCPEQWRRHDYELRLAVHRITSPLWVHGSTGLQRNQLDPGIHRTRRLAQGHTVSNSAPPTQSEIAQYSPNANATTDATPTTLTAPAFADDTGDAQILDCRERPLPAITVPTATGNPTPTYAAVGSLPAGIAFDTGTRVLSGTPTATGSGTITIRATNSEGDADWTVAYTTAATPPPDTAPARPDAPTLTVNSATRITAVGLAPDDGGDPIINYDWRHRITSPLGAWVSRSNVSNLTQAFIGLQPATPYRFQFRATNSIGDSPYSPSVDATTDATPTTTTTYEVRVKATAAGFTDSEYSDPPETIDVTA